MKDLMRGNGAKSSERTGSDKMPKLEPPPQVHNVAQYSGHRVEPDLSISLPAPQNQNYADPQVMQMVNAPSLFEDLCQLDHMTGVKIQGPRDMVNMLNLYLNLALCSLTVSEGGLDLNAEPLDEEDLNPKVGPEHLDDPCLALLSCHEDLIMAKTRSTKKHVDNFFISTGTSWPKAGMKQTCTETEELTFNAQADHRVGDGAITTRKRKGSGEAYT